MARGALGPQDGLAANDDARIEVVAEEVRRIARSELVAICNIGDIILRNFYGNNEAAWRARDPRKEHSIRKLAARLREVISQKKLYRAVNMCLLCRRIAFVPTSEHITISHVDTVLSAPPERQEVLLAETERLKLTVRQLREKCHSVRVKKVPVAALDARPSAPKDVGARVGLAQELLHAALEDVRVLRESGEECSDELIRRLREIADECDAVLARLERPSIAQSDAQSLKPRTDAGSTAA